MIHEPIYAILKSTNQRGVAFETSQKDWIFIPLSKDHLILSRDSLRFVLKEEDNFLNSHRGIGTNQNFQSSKSITANLRLEENSNGRKLDNSSIKTINKVFNNGEVVIMDKVWSDLRPLERLEPVNNNQKIPRRSYVPTVQEPQSNEDRNVSESNYTPQYLPLEDSPKSTKKRKLEIKENQASSSSPGSPSSPATKIAKYKNESYEYEKNIDNLLNSKRINESNHEKERKREVIVLIEEEEEFEEEEEVIFDAPKPVKRGKGKEEEDEEIAVIPCLLNSSSSSSSSIIPFRRKLPTVSEILSDYGLVVGSSISEISQAMGISSAATLISSYIPDIPENFNTADQVSVNGVIIPIPHSEFRFTSDLKAHWRCITPHGDHAKELFCLKNLSTLGNRKLSSNFKSTELIQNLEYFYYKDFHVHYKQNKFYSMDGDEIWKLLESYGWKSKEESEIMYFKPAQSYLTELTEGFHLFETGKQLLEYLHRFPYPMQPDQKLLYTLKRFGWKVDKNSSIVYYNEMMLSISQARTLLWTYPHLFYLPNLGKNNNEAVIKRILLSLGWK